MLKLERPRHTGHVLEWIRTTCSVLALTANVVALSILLTR